MSDAMPAGLRPFLVVISASLALAPVARADIPELAGTWHLDSNGASSPDSSGHGLNATKVGSPTAVSPARFGDGLKFPSENDYLNAGSHPELQPTRISVLAWVRSATTPGKVKGVVSQGATGTCDHSSYSLYTGGSADPVSGLRFYVWNGTAAPRTPPAPNTIWDGQWHLATGTYDGSAVRLYVDGQLIGSTPATGNIAYGLGGNNNFIIGGALDNSCFEDVSWSGDLDEVRVYNRALTQEEISYLALAGHTTPPELPIPSTVPGVTPPPPPSGANLTAPEILTRDVDPRTRGRVYECTQGTWSNLAADPQFTYTWFVSGRLKGVGAGGVTRDGRVQTGPTYVLPEKSAGSTFYCQVTAVGADGNVVRAVTEPEILTGLPDSVTPASSTKGPREYGNFRIRGIDVFQVVQPTNGAPQFDGSGPFSPGWCGGGTPTPFAPVGDQCEAANPSQAAYRGVTLDASKRTFARVYVDMSDARTRFPDAGLRVTLNADPDLSAAGARSRGAWQITQNPPVSVTPYVTAAERANPSFSVQFELNPGWLTAVTRDQRGRPFGLQATVELDNRAAGAGTGKGESPRDECLGDAAVACAADDNFRLTGIPVAEVPNMDVELVSLLTRLKDNRIGSGAGVSKPSPALLDRVRQLFPGGERMFIRNNGLAARVDKVESLTSSDALCAIYTADEAGLRACRMAYVDEALFQLISTQASLRADAAVIGVHRYTIVPGGAVEPGFQVGPPISRDQRLPARLTINDGSLRRPLTATAREFGHALGLPTAGTACGASGEAWPDDQQGRLQGLASDFGKVRVDSPTSSLFDLESFCAPEATAWLSALNWNRSLTLIKTLPGSRIKRLSGASQAGQAFVSGLVGPKGARILRVTAADPANLPLSPDPGSPLKVRSLDAGGKELSVVGAPIQSGGVPGAGTFAVGIPAGAAAVEVLVNGQVTDRKARSKPPKVRVLAPGAGKHLRGGTLRVRWAASDPDKDTLTAIVDFAANGRSGWRAVYTGPSAGSATIPASFFERSSAGRIRVRVSDGFSETSARSGAIRTDGRPPTTRIVAPLLSRLQGRGRTELNATALDDRGIALPSRAFTWFAGKRRLGRGATLRIALAPGKVALRVEARDRFGRLAKATRHLTVEPVRLALTRFDVPVRVGTGAKSMRVTVATTVAATLRAGGKRFAVGPKAKKLTLPLPRSPRQGIFKVTATVTARGPNQPGLRQALSVLRS